MGILFYDGQAAIELPDRQLRHLQLAIVDKLRRREGFALAWESESEPLGVTLWISPASSLRFVFTELKDQPANRAWVDAFLATAVAGTMSIVAEPKPVG
ncbi:MAG: hypothetical protein V4479_13490 [Actinomycetota bacterium]